MSRPRWVPVPVQSFILNLNIIRSTTIKQLPTTGRGYPYLSDFNLSSAKPFSGVQSLAVLSKNGVIGNSGVVLQ